MVFFFRVVCGVDIVCCYRATVAKSSGNNKRFSYTTYLHEFYRCLYITLHKITFEPIVTFRRTNGVCRLKMRAQSVLVSLCVVQRRSCMISSILMLINSKYDGYLFVKYSFDEYHCHFFMIDQLNLSASILTFLDWKRIKHMEDIHEKYRIVVS